MTTQADVRAAAGNLLLAFYVRSQIPQHLDSWRVADGRFAGLCEAGCGAGLAESPAELELMVAHVVELLPAPAGGERGPMWIWLMQARWILARRLSERLFPKVAAA